MLKKAVQRGRRRIETGGGTDRTSWGRSPIQWILANGKTPPAIPPSENLNRYVEDFDESRTMLADFFSILLGLVGRGQGLVDFPNETPFNFRDLLCAHAEDAATLGEFFEVGLDAEPGDVRRERVKGQHILIP